MKVTNSNLAFVEPLKVGDDFIYISKYGPPYVKCKVKLIYATTVLLDDCNYQDLRIISEKNVHYNYNDCRKIIHKLSAEGIKKRKEFFDNMKKLQDRKANL